MAFAQSFEGRDVSARNCDIGPCTSKTLGDGTPDAPAGAGDQRLLSIERKQMS